MKSKMQKTMKLSSALVFISVFLTSCQSGPTVEEETQRADFAESGVLEAERKIVEIQEKADELETKLSDVRSKISDVEAAHSKLDEEIASFRFYDWADVVPKVESQSSDLKTEISDLDSAAQ